MDRLSVSFGVRSFEPDTSAWDQVAVSSPGGDQQRERRSAMVERVHVGIQQHPAEPSMWIGRLDFNPARMLDPEGWELVGVEALGAALDKLSEVACHLIEPGVERDRWRVTRLDVARDFQTDHPATIVRGLGPVHRPWAKRNLIHFDPSRGGAQTLMVGSGAGVVRLYDKHAETKGAAPEGTLRWEVEARKAWVERYGRMRELGDVNGDNVRELAEDRWVWSAMDRGLSGTEEVVEQVMRLDVSPTVKRGLVGHLVMESMGCNYRLPSATAAKYRRLARQAGVAVVEGGEVEGLREGRARLDWESGREVLEVGF